MRYKECRHCTYSEYRSSYGKHLWCSKHDEIAEDACEDWEREPGADDDEGDTWALERMQARKHGIEDY